jgi:sec-independent protein translocase protein TatA
MLGAEGGTALMPDIGPDKLLIILVVALLVVGPKKIPDIARSLGKGLRGFKDAISGARDEFDAGKDDQAASATPPAAPPRSAPPSATPPADR